MNRESKRMMQRQGQGPEGDAAPARTAPATGREPKPGREPGREPFRPARFLREVRSELRQVAWPNRAEVVNYTTVTFISLLVLIGFIFILNYAFAKGVLWLFKT